MFEFTELPTTFPLGAILFDFLFLLVAIPIEGYVLNLRLRFDKKTSIFYAICINLFTAVIGWITFFFIEPILPVNLKSQLISYVFFNQYNVQSLMILLAFIIFFATFLLKYFLLKLVLLSLAEPTKNELEFQAYPRRNFRRASKVKLQNTNLVTTILVANSLSYSAIILIILLTRSR
ncbi:MAG: filament integrity protein fraC [Tolypothrix brevis GSE-NOS-MK-07-07A]|jgi:hypothetical protein|nr:filament integrity protein fraC [Tolypothrix brevis GSE-NOS-MK-07-07A]